MSENTYRKVALELLQHPDKFGDAEQAFQRLLFWSQQGGFQYSVDDTTLLRLLTQAIDGNELAKLEIGIICAGLDV